MSDDNIGVHRTHCCVFHGCKYGEDSTCPVVQRDVIQDYLCEDCGIDGVQSIDHLKRLMFDKESLCPHCGHVL